MTLGEAIYAACIAHAPLKALIATRIYPLRAPAGIDNRYVIWSTINAVPATTHNEAAGITITTVQFSAFAANYEDAVAVRDALVAALDNVELGNGDKGVLEDQREDYEEQAGLYRADADISF